MSNNCCDGASVGLGLNLQGVTDLNPVITVSNSGQVSTITLDIPNGSYYRMELWLSDSNTSAQPTSVIPSVTAVASWTRYTDANGDDSAFQIEHGGSSRTWYLWLDVGTGALEVSDAITIGS